MGNRTLVLLENDNAGAWSKDLELGQKIFRAANYATGRTMDPDYTDLGYGRVVECQHADTLTLAVVHSYRFTPLTFGHWQRGQTDVNMKLSLLKKAAAELGYNLVKKPE